MTVWLFAGGKAGTFEIGELEERRAQNHVYNVVWEEAGNSPKPEANLLA